MNYANYKQSVGAYAADVHVASAHAGRYAVAVALGWVTFPFAMETAVLHPVDALRLQLKLQGLPVPSDFTVQQVTSGLVEALFGLGVLILVQMVCTALYYRRASMEGASVATPVLWPLAALTGLIGNGVWWYATGAFDPSGFIVGLSSSALAVGCEIFVNRLGREFVLGSAKAVALLG
jgi:hypothetical protein